MSVCVVDFACLAHEVLQVLPGGRGREVLDHNAIASPGTRWSPPTKSTPVAISTSKVTTSTTSAAAASCVLNTDSSSIKIFTVKILDNIFGITAILKLGKPKTLLDRDVPYSSIALEKLLNIPVMKIRLAFWMKMSSNFQFGILVCSPWAASCLNNYHGQIPEFLASTSNIELPIETIEILNKDKLQTSIKSSWSI